MVLTGSAHLASHNTHTNGRTHTVREGQAMPTDDLYDLARGPLSYVHHPASQDDLLASLDGFYVETLGDACPYDQPAGLGLDGLYVVLPA